jgi:hypothetical protein
MRRLLVVVATSLSLLPLTSFAAAADGGSPTDLPALTRGGVLRILVP